jgi:multisubunit Na+/H+ antiporter MnhB subunit
MSVSQSLSLVGVVLIVLGLGCFPVGYGINPVRDLSMFENLVDLGLFWKVGVMLVGIGVAFLLVGGIVFVFTSSSSQGAPK